MNNKVKELAEFHNLDVNVMQAIYDDIIGSCTNQNAMSEHRAKATMQYVAWLEERLLHSDRMHVQAMEMLRTLMGKMK